MSNHEQVKLLPLICVSIVLTLPIAHTSPSDHPSSTATNVAMTSGPGSWNPNVQCTPVVVTVEQILGNQTNPLGGAAENGSTFNPGISSPYGPDNAKRWLTPSPTTPPGWVSPGPPCTITNANGQIVSAFVQINGIERGFRAEEDSNNTYMPINGGSAYPNGPQTDTTFNILTPGYGDCTSTNTTACTHTLHAEIDHDWKGAGYCGLSTACDNNALVDETAAYKSLIDVQGFVFWDPDHLTEAAHSFSGWELHPLTAWRISNASSDYSVSATTNPMPVVAGQSASSSVTVNTFNLFTGNVSFTTTVYPGTGASGPTPNATTTPSTIFISPGATGTTTLTVKTVPSDTGNYTVTVTGTNGTLVRQAAVAVYVVDFTVAANPNSISVSIGSTAQSKLTLSSINGFAGNVSLVATVSPASLIAGLLSEPAASLDPSLVSLLPSSIGQATLTVSASLLTTPGVYSVTVISSGGGASHSTTVTVTVTVAGVG